jgi:hypothetical protein
MLSALSLGLLFLGPFVAIAFATREGDFRAPRLAVAAIVGQLLGILILVAVNTLLATSFLRQNRLVVFLPPSSQRDQLVTFAVIISYALAVAATVLLARWAYVRSRGS